MMTYTINSLTCTKLGNTEDENEDAYIITQPDNSHGYIRMAIADGATESSFSKEWAELLVCYFYGFEYKNNSFLDNIHPFLKRHWLQRVSADDLPWYAQQKLELGAFATFLGVDVNLETGECNIIAVGDSNFFAFRGNELKTSFPVERAADFGNTPFLISSEPHKNKAERLFSEQVLQLIPGDTLILATDAISYWMLSEVEKGNKPLNYLQQLLSNEKSKGSFSGWLQEQRENSTIKNDDTTILLIQFSDGTT